MSWTKESRRAHRARNHDRILAQDRARKKRYGRDCLTCGKRTDGSGGRAKAPLYCADCAPAAYTVWTREAIILAMQTFAARYGHPPSATEWNPPYARRVGRDDWADRFHSDGDYPQANTAQRAFGSWNAAVAAAGFEPLRSGGGRRARKPHE